MANNYNERLEIAIGFLEDYSSTIKYSIRELMKLGENKEINALLPDGVYHYIGINEMKKSKDKNTKIFLKLVFDIEKAFYEIGKVNDIDIDEIIEKKRESNKINPFMRDCPF